MRFGCRHQTIGTAILIFAGLLFPGCKEKAAPPPASPPEVSFVTVKPERVVLTTELPGRINAFLVAEIRPQVSGLLQKRLFEEGAYVKAGDILYQIDPSQYQSAYNEAKAALSMAESQIALAEANLPAIRSRAERLRGLVKIHAAGQQDSDDAEAALRLAEANLEVRKTAIGVNRAAMESAAINLSYTPIKAPISGRIGRSSITVGAMVTAYQPTPLAVIQQLDPVYVDVTQASAELLRLRRNLEGGGLKRSGSSERKVRLLLEDGTPYPFQGTMQFRDVTVDPTTGSVILRLVFANPKQVLLPGMFVRAVVEEGVKEQALLIPQPGVTRDTKGNAIGYVLDQSGKVGMRVLTMDRAIGDQWIVTSGLAPGDRIVVEGVQNIRHGSVVRAVPFEGSGTTTQPPASSR